MLGWKTMSALLTKALCDINRLYFNAGECTGVLNKMKISKTTMMVKMKSFSFVRSGHTGVVSSDEATTRRRGRRRDAPPRRAGSCSPPPTLDPPTRRAAASGPRSKMDTGRGTPAGYAELLPAAQFTSAPHGDGSVV